jgi:hypothetical protein
MSLRPMIGICALALVSGACASGGSSSAPAAGASSSTAVRRGNANLITESEIASANLETIFDVIERLRPNMLRTRGQMGRISGATATESGASSSRIKVYHNGTAIGDVTMLRGIQAASVKQVDFLSSSDATTRFGTGHDAGAILITSK